MTQGQTNILKAFLLPLVPALVGGAIWESFGLPLGWLMGSAIVVGYMSLTGKKVGAPKSLEYLSHTVLGASVGLTLTPEASTEIVTWAPMMVVAAAIGIALAVLVTPVMARVGKISTTTAFYSLLPGGVIEMANLGEKHGADRMTIAALHAVRVAMIVTFIPIGVFLIADENADAILQDQMTTSAGMVALIILVGVLGGMLAKQLKVPAPFLLGAILSVGMASSLDLLAGSVPEIFMAVAQLIIGFSLGSKFKKQYLHKIPRAMATAVPLLGFIMAVMALLGVVAGSFISESTATLILCFSIGGMAEMILTAKALGQHAAMIAGFQVVRAVLVNSLANAIWVRISQSPFLIDKKG